MYGSESRATRAGQGGEGQAGRVREGKGRDGRKCSRGAVLRPPRIRPEPARTSQDRSLPLCPRSSGQKVRVVESGADLLEGLVEEGEEGEFLKHAQRNTSRTRIQRTSFSHNARRLCPSTAQT